MSVQRCDLPNQVAIQEYSDSSCLQFSAGFLNYDYPSQNFMDKGILYNQPDRYTLQVIFPSNTVNYTLSNFILAQYTPFMNYTELLNKPCITIKSNSSAEVYFKYACVENVKYGSNQNSGLKTKLSLAVLAISMLFV
ncbi:hypothetical protein HDV06_006796 [Boothiomyces sp. JEL0866]|nr:hypothetical protein HDV06_006796 [Boothiomyces sp. JEL0866]